MGRGTRLQAEKAGHCLTLDSGLKQSCTGGDFQLLTNNSGRGRGRRGTRLPAADPQEAPDACTGLSSLRADSQGSRGMPSAHAN